MREEIERILAMQERGELTREEAAARIEALARETAGRRDQTRPSFDDLERSIGSLGREFGNVFARASKGLGDALRPETWVNASNSATLSRTTSDRQRMQVAPSPSMSAARRRPSRTASSKVGSRSLADHYCHALSQPA